MNINKLKAASELAALDHNQQRSEVTEASNTLVFGEQAADANCAWTPLETIKEEYYMQKLFSLIFTRKCSRGSRTMTMKKNLIPKRTCQNFSLKGLGTQSSNLKKEQLCKLKATRRHSFTVSSVERYYSVLFTSFRAPWVCECRLFAYKTL